MFFSNAAKFNHAGKVTVLFTERFTLAILIDGIYTSISITVSLSAIFICDKGVGSGIFSPSSSNPYKAQPNSSLAEIKASSSSFPLVATSKSGKTIAISESQVDEAI